MKLVWLRGCDLRLSDHPALALAFKEAKTSSAGGLLSSNVKCCFVMTPGQWRLIGMAERRLNFIKRQLNWMAAQLEPSGVKIEILRANTFKDVPRVLSKFCKTEGVTEVLACQEPGSYEKERDEAVEATLEGDGLKVRYFMERNIIGDYEEIKTKTETPFKVFTPFKNCALSFLRARRPEKPIPSPLATPPLKDVATEGENALLFKDCEKDEDWPVGSDHAHEVLKNFIANKLTKYKEMRDFPAVDGTSVISPYLANGFISPIEILYEVVRTVPSALGDAPTGAPTWVSELYWREFNRYLMHHFPRVSKSKAFQEHTDRLKWDSNPEGLQRWKDGQTGFPIVDSAMRQLKKKGWMHNRLRMIAASFLTKDLHIDWREGEKHFAEWLMDFDFPSNNGGWQWAASTGADAAPYFRIFNPTSQGERFDANGVFTKTMCPELKSVPVKFLHSPWKWGSIKALGDKYPAPMVDHAKECVEAKKRFEDLKS